MENNEKDYKQELLQLYAEVDETKKELMSQLREIGSERERIRLEKSILEEQRMQFMMLAPPDRRFGQKNIGSASMRYPGEDGPRTQEEDDTEPKFEQSLPRGHVNARPSGRTETAIHSGRHLHSKPEKEMQMTFQSGDVPWGDPRGRGQTPVSHNTQYYEDEDANDSKLDQLKTLIQSIKVISLRTISFLDRVIMTSI